MHDIRFDHANIGRAGRVRLVALSLVVVVAIGVVAVALTVASTPLKPVAVPEVIPPSPSALADQHRKPAPGVDSDGHFEAVPSPLLLVTAADSPGRNPSLAAFLDKQAGTSRLSADFAVRVPAVTAAADVAAVVAVLRDVSDLDAMRNEAIDLLRRSGYATLDRELLSLLDRTDERERFRAFMMQHLGTSVAESSSARDRMMVLDRMRLAMADRDEAVRREALTALVRVRDPAAMAVARTGLDDPTWARSRDVVIHCMHDLDLREGLPTIRSLAYDQDQAVRIAALYVLGQWRDEASRSAFIEARGSSVKRLQRAGELALRSLDGATGPALVTPVVTSRSQTPASSSDQATP